MTPVVVVRQLATVDPNAARAAAREILRGREFRPAGSPKPLEGVVTWIGDRLNGIAEGIGDFFSGLFKPLFELLPGNWGVILGIVLCVGIAAFVIWLVSRNAVRAPNIAATASNGAAMNIDPKDLEAAAQRAERDEQFELAIRLRYRAGLIRLDHAGVIELQPWNTAALLTRKVASPRFDRITDTFEAITYGGRAATGTQANTVRAEWSTLLTEVGHR